MARTLSRLLALNSPGDVARLGVIAALLALLIFGGLRYDNFLSPYNILSFLRYNSMFALVALGMCFVIMTGGIDLSVGSVAALSSVVADISRYADIRFEFDTQDLADMRVGGVFGLGEVDDMLEALETNFGVRAERIGDKLVRIVRQDP